MSDDDDESRANRLRDRRRRSRDRGRQQEEQEQESTDESEPTETGETDKTDKPSEPSKSNESALSGVKDTQVGTYMYLPESLADDLGYQFKFASAEYERVHDQELEKNRHWYPLVVGLGLELLEEMGPHELHDELDRVLDE